MSMPSKTSAFNRSVGRRLVLKMTSALSAAAAILPIGGLGRRAFAQDGAVGQVAKLRGQARVACQGQNIMIAEGTKLMTGDQVVTGPDARLKLQFLDGSTMTMGEASKLSIDKAAFSAGQRNIAATLLDGIVRCVVAKAGDGSSFEVSSSLVTSAARGTEWIVSIKDHTTSLFVLDGVVNA